MGRYVFRPRFRHLKGEQVHNHYCTIINKALFQYKKAHTVVYSNITIRYFIRASLIWKMCWKRLSLTDEYFWVDFIADSPCQIQSYCTFEQVLNSGECTCTVEYQKGEGGNRNVM